MRRYGSGLRAVSVVAVLATLALGAPAAGATAPAVTDTTRPLANTAHLRFLTDRVAPPAQSGHTTYRLARNPRIGVLWTYAEPDGSGGYERIGGGEYDPATDTYTQGAFNADDVSRAAVAFTRHWRRTGARASRAEAYQLLRGLTYLQTATGPNRGNVVLWMQPDGTLNRSAEPVELPDPSDSGPSYWLARTVWALGEGYAAFRDVDPDFARFLRRRLDLAIAAVDRQVLAPRYGRYLTVDGLRWPAWLITDGADASSEAVYGLVAYVRAGGGRDARRALRQLADGLARMPLGDAYRWPYGALMPWALSRSVWHAWGDQMAGALAEAGALTGRAAYTRAAVGEVARFTPHMLASGGPDNGWLPAPADRNQIAYGADATLQNLLRTAAAAGRAGPRDLAAVAASWYFGNNAAGQRMYDPATGRTFDGVAIDGTVNVNSGAESTIHGFLSMLALDAHPRVAARARAAQRVRHVTWQLVEAEAGTASGDATTVTPADPWTGESLYSGGGFVRLRDGGSVELTVDLPVTDRYRLMPVVKRRRAPEGTAVTRYRLGGAPVGAVDHGGAGPRGVTPMAGYLDVATLRASPRMAAGASVVRVDGAGASAAVDAVLVQPRVESLVLRGGGGAQALLRSFARGRQVRWVTLPGARALTARSYDRAGRLVEAATGTDGRVRAPVAPGGFTVVRG